MASLRNKKSIFDTIEQRVDHVDPTSIKLAGDRCLLRDIPGTDRLGSIWLPEVCRDQERLRQAEVVAVGPGDVVLEAPVDQTNYDADGYVRLKRRRVKCWRCKGEAFEGRPFGCAACEGTGYGRLPMDVQPGQRVLYSRRLESEIFINGNRYSMAHAEQAIFAILSTSGSEPLRDRIVVSRDAVHQKTDGGLYIPQGAQEERSEGLVLAVGPGRFMDDGSRIPLDVQVGDHVVFGDGCGSDFTIKGERLLVMKEKDVLGVIDAD